MRIAETPSEERLAQTAKPGVTKFLVVGCPYCPIADAYERRKEREDRSGRVERLASPDAARNASMGRGVVEPIPVWRRSDLTAISNTVFGSKRVR